MLYGVGTLGAVMSRWLLSGVPARSSPGDFEGGGDGAQGDRDGIPDSCQDQRLPCALGKQIRYMSGNGGGGREARGIDAE